MKLLALLLAAVPASAQELRLPSWELGAVVARDALAVMIFGEGTIDLDAVRVIYAPSPTDTPMVWGNTMRMPVGHDLSTGTLVHELTHVWQYQTSGTSYISDSLLQQACHFIVDGDRNAAYRYTLQAGKSFFAYEAEQQAEIVEAFALSKTKRDDPVYKSLIAELRSRKAPRRFTPLDVSLTMERDAGLPSRWHAIPAAETRFGAEAGSVPQLEVRW